MKFKQEPNECVTLIGETFEIDLPKLCIGKTYFGYNDGKINLSRIAKILITDKINLDKNIDKIKQEDLDLIKEEIKQCNWLYSNKQTNIYYGITKGYSKELIFLKTQHNKWCSIGDFTSFLLDADNSITINMLKKYKKRLEENKYDIKWCEILADNLLTIFGTDDIDKIIKELE